MDNFAFIAGGCTVDRRWPAWYECIHCRAANTLL